MRNIVVFSGSSHPALTDLICDRLGIRASSTRLSNFSNRETNVEIHESVRDQDVYIVQSGCGKINDNLMELLIMIAACRTASAARVTAVIPCFPYARQSDGLFRVASSTSTQQDAEHEHGLWETDDDRDDATTVGGGPENGDVDGEPCPAAPPSPAARAVEGMTRQNSTVSIASSSNQPGRDLAYKQWSARPGTLIADMLTAAGADHVIVLDLHDPQFQGFFDVPVDLVYAEANILNYIRFNVEDYRKAVIVSPDAGGAKRATSVAAHLGVDFALIHRDGNSRRMRSVASDPFMAATASGACTPTAAASAAALNSSMAIVGNVRNRRCIVIDDIADTCRTLCQAARTLRAHGASEVICIVTHGMLSKNLGTTPVGHQPQHRARQRRPRSVLERLERSGVDRLVVTNSIPQERRGQEQDIDDAERLRWRRWIKEGRFEVIDISGILGEAIRRSHNGESLSQLFR